MGFETRQARVRATEALELRAKQFRSRAGTWPFRMPHQPLDLKEIAGEAVVAADGRTVLRMEWGPYAWELWVLALPSGILLYCDTDGDETRVLASVKRGNSGEADGFFLERLAESRGEYFGIELAGPPPDRVRSSIGDREFLADVFVELFEGTEAEASFRAPSTRSRSLRTGKADPTEPADFRQDIVLWLGDVLTAPPPARRQPRVREHDPSA
jgi:hypothetical protein